MKFRKKPVVIEAIQYDGTNYEDIFKFTNSKAELHTKPNYLIILTLEGDMKAKINDWIIKGVKGEFYPCKPDIFEETYEEVTDNPTNKTKVRK